MARASKRPPVVDPGQIPLLVATCVVAVDHGPDYVLVTLGVDQMWGQPDIQERTISGRLLLTLGAWEVLKEIASGKSVALPLGAELVH